jgi:hypothetical protein
VSDRTARPIQEAVGPGHPAPARAHVSNAALWFGIFGGPAAWSLQTLINLPVAAHACFPRLDPVDSPIISVRGIALGVSILALVACAFATGVAFRSWSRTRHEHPEAAGEGAQHTPETALIETSEGRTRFMALAGVLASVTFLVVSSVHAATVFLVIPCGVV